MKLHINTNQMSNKEWLRERCDSIGASDCGAILGVSPWKTPLDIYYDKVNKNAEESDAFHLWLGNALEPIIKKRLKIEHGMIVNNDNKIRYDQIYHYMSANLDGWCPAEKVPVEYKTAGHWDGIPDTYYAQLQHQMMITQSPYAYIAVLVLGYNRRLVLERFDRDDEFIAIMRKKMVVFWNSHVKAGVPPEPTCERDCRLRFPEHKEDTCIEADDEIIKDVFRLLTIRDEKKDLDREKATLTTNVMKYMKDNEVLTWGDDRVVVWRKSGKTRRFIVKDGR